jgi:hypothetical protein
VRQEWKKWYKYNENKGRDRARRAPLGIRRGMEECDAVKLVLFQEKRKWKK